jgi:hypothetical protein
VLDSIMEIELSQIKCIPPVISLEHLRTEVGYDEAECWGEIICGSAGSIEFPERDASSISRKNS